MSQHQECPHCQQKLVLERVETKESWTTISSCSTASNIRGAGRTLGNLMSIAGRRFERALVTIPEIMSSHSDLLLHQKAEESLKEAKLRLSKQARVLLFGSVDSGKSEILKQLRSQHRIPYTPAELESFRQLVYKYIIYGMSIILDAIDERGLALSADNTRYAELVRGIRGWDLGDNAPFPPALRDAVASLWNDGSVKIIWEERDVLDLSESLSHFLSSLDRLLLPTYMPTDQDIQHLDAPSGRGVVETTFQFDSSEIVIIDPAPFMGERRKWIHRFSDMTCILFVVNLACYDQRLVEEPSVNQMQESMVLWDSISNSQWFQDTSLILLFNKRDLFEKKVQTAHMRDYFPDYEGFAGDADAGVEYFIDCFIKLAHKFPQQKQRMVYIHVTDSSDTALLQFVKAAAEDTLLSFGIVDKKAPFSPPLGTGHYHLSRLLRHNSQNASITTPPGSYNTKTHRSLRTVLDQTTGSSAPQRVFGQ